MDSTAYRKIKEVLEGNDLSEVKIKDINGFLKEAGHSDADINEVIFATKLTDKVLKGAALKVTFDINMGNTPIVTIGELSRKNPVFGIAFITALLASIEAAAMDKFLPEPQQPKTASGNKRDGAGSPSATRSLPVRGGNY